MATPGHEGSHTRRPIELSSDSESDVSDAEYDEAGPSNVACQWRTDRFNTYECSRYFDCPSHTIERALSENHEDIRDGDNDIVMSDVSREADDGPVVEDRSPSPPPAESPAASVRLDAASGTAGNPIVLPDGGSPPRRRGPPVGSPVVIEDDDEHVLRGTSQNTGASMMPSGPSPRGVIHSVPPGPAIGPGIASTNVMTPLSTPRNTEPMPQPRRIMLPRWQPDAEVTYCPICRTQFSIFIRKHHCRKCGRVVCNACSPHRITIPYQYIVQPPGTPQAPPQRPVSSLARDEWSSADFNFNSLGGGERVRLCNPCVPDPNTTPPQTQNPSGERSHSRSQSGANQRHPSSTGSSSAASNRWSAYFAAAPAPDTYTRSRSATMSGNTASSSSTRPPSNPYTTASAYQRILAGTPPAYFTSQSPVAQRLYTDQRVASRHQPLLDLGGPGPSTAAAAAAAPSSSSAPQVDRSLPPIPQPRHQIAEEDECPVCHRELPERTLPNSEALREAHITICITAHSRYSGTPTGSGSAGAGEEASPPAAPRRTGMFPYVATEKDCVDSAECTICLEEFEVGVPMARLECLCRFHRQCIGAWWQRHPGRCPMHQHDSFGY